MKKIITSALILILYTVTISQICANTAFEGKVTEEGTSSYTNRIIDKDTGKGINGAKITLPKQHYSTKTDQNGFFELDTYIDGASIMSVQKEHYKPFSVTIDEQSLSTPLVLSIEKSNTGGIVVDSEMYHLGDNNYSDLSANAGEFHMSAIGPAYNKRFIMKNLKFNQPIYLIIGSIIGIDTNMARNMGQNHITNAFANPPEVYFNGNKIAEIQINGDGQRIRVPNSLIKKNQVNELSIKTGRNLMQTAYIDYDDIEFMNIFFEN